MKKIFFCPVIAFLLIIAGCNRHTTSKQSETIFAMDTVMEISLYGVDTDSGRQAMERAKNVLQELEGRISVTRETSEIFLLNQDNVADVGKDTYDLVKAALDLCEKTDGSLDISIYPVVREWGFTTDSHHVPSDERIKELLDLVDYSRIGLEEKRIVLPENMAIDLGSVAKGYAGDILISELKQQGVKHALLSLGGNVQTLGCKPDGANWNIAITDPHNPDAYIGSVKVADKAVVTSGGYQRYFEENGVRYHHIIDPATGFPVNNGLSSVTIVGDVGILCDAYSTALFVMGYEKACDFWRAQQNFEVIFVMDNGDIHITKGLEGNFTTVDQKSVHVVQ